MCYYKTTKDNVVANSLGESMCILLEEFIFNCVLFEDR